MKRRKSYKLEVFNLKQQVPRSWLTPVQQEIMRFIELFDEHYRRFPSLREIGRGEIDGKQMNKTKRTTTRNIAEILDRLFERGWIGKAEDMGKGRWMTRAANDEWDGPRRDY